MLIICNAPMLVMGLFFLISGRLRLSSKREIRGGYARLAGFILMLPLTFDLIMLWLGVVGTGRDGAQATNTWFILDILFIVAALIAVVGIAVLMPHTIRDQLPPPVVLSKKVTVADAARYLRISEREVMYFIGKGELKAQLTGNSYTIDKDSLIAFVKN